MPSAHGAIFCRKELREKVRVKVRFFLGLSQRTRPIFCHKQLWEKIGAILYRSKSQRTQTDFHSYFLSTIKNRSVCAGHNQEICLKKILYRRSHWTTLRRTVTRLSCRWRYRQSQRHLSIYMSSWPRYRNICSLTVMSTLRTNHW